MSEQGPYFDAIDAKRRANREASANDSTEVRPYTPSQRRVAKALLAATSLLAVGGLYVGASAFFRDLRTPLEERYIFPYTPTNCEPGWDAPSVDPVELSRGMRSMFVTVAIEDNMNRSSSVTSGVMTDSHEQAVHSLRRTLELTTLGGEDFETLDETVEVACKAADGTYMASENMVAALPYIEQADYGIDLITGEVTTPR